MKKFKEIGVNQQICKAIAELGFVNPTEVQKESIPFLLTNDSDLISLAQTGTGKTAAFGIPAIQQVDLDNKNVQVIILCPTRELCVQICKDLESYSKYVDGIKLLAIYGGVNIQNQIKSLKKGVQIIIGTPGRTKDLLNRKLLKLELVSRVVLDEADEMLSMGFKDELDFILEKTSEEKQTMLFSATISKEVRNIAKRYMRVAKEISVSRINSSAKNIQHHIYDVSSRNKYEALKRIADFNPNIYAIIFCRTKRHTKEITNKFILEGYNADAIHGDLSQNQREEVMQRFREKSLQILIATDVAARGLDVDDITHVINYSLPDDPEVYIHRSGRTGRAGKSGISIVISNKSEVRKIKLIEKKGAIKFQYKDVPSGNEICSNQLYKLIDKIENTNVDEKQIQPFLENIYKKLEWLSREELIKRFVSAEFNRFLKYYKESNTLKASKSKKRDSRNRNNKTLTSFSINIGRKHRATPLDIISIVNRALKSNDIEIGKIELSRYNTVFEIDNDYKEEFINNIKKIDFKGNKLVLENNFGDSFQKTYSDRKSKNRSEEKGRFRNKSRRRNRSKNRYR
ncbi:MAG: DEAD/DEAH box helicase [Flavobacteriaceae bacterium]|nr:DEAD/DEAH box helicase [Flavobacteriaceae bacterium]|tara:strand:- start:3937 stop:5649 length:1713 start_codon:yes stop_codon:yes gene_type:complete